MDAWFSEKLEVFEVFSRKVLNTGKKIHGKPFEEMVAVLPSPLLKGAFDILSVSI